MIPIRLSDLNFSFTVASSLDYNFKEFFKWKTQLNHIDFTACGLDIQGKTAASFFSVVDFNCKQFYRHDSFG